MILDSCSISFLSSSSLFLTYEIVRCSMSIDFYILSYSLNSFLCHVISYPHSSFSAVLRAILFKLQGLKACNENKQVEMDSVFLASILTIQEELTTSGKFILRKVDRA